MVLFAPTVQIYLSKIPFDLYVLSYIRIFLSNSRRVLLEKLVSELV
jgi:hypothetical protein